MRDQTLQLSQMFLAACDRSFPEPLLALLRNLASNSSEDEILERAEGVARLGHHSCHAILLGMVRGSNNVAFKFSQKTTEHSTLLLDHET